MNKKIFTAVVVAVAIGGFVLTKSKVKPDTTVNESLAKPKEAASKGTTGTASQPIENTSLTPAAIGTNDQSAVAATESTEAAEKPAPTPVDQTTQESLGETLRADKELAKVASVNSVECLDGKCTVELEAKDNQNVQMKMIAFMVKHQEEYGRYSKFDEDKDNPKVTRFVISKEQVK